MATIDQLSTALANADKAGDADAAATFAAEIRRMQAAPQADAAPSIADRIAGGVKDFAKSQGDLAAGELRGAGSIGATILGATLDPLVRATGANNDYFGPTGSILGRTDRREQMDAALRDMGADTDSTSFGVGKLASEVAGTAGVGGTLAKGALGAAKLAGLDGAPLVQAITNGLRTGGFTLNSPATATGALGKVAQAVQNGATRVGTGAVTGGAAAGLIDPQDAQIGAVIGGGLPVVTGAAGLIGKGLRSVGQAVVPSVAQKGALSSIADAVGPNIQKAVGDIQTYYPKGAESIPVSASAITRNPELAQLEQGSRLRVPGVWNDFDANQRKAVFDNVMQATQDAEGLGQRYADRQANWKAAWEDAANSQKPLLWVQRMNQFGGDLQKAMTSGEASNPDVLKVLKAIDAEMDRVGPAFSPLHLQQIRANLRGSMKPMSDNVYKSAPRDAPAIKSLISEIDDVLNTSTGGKWQKVLRGYAQDSDAVRAAKAAQKVRNAFVDADTGRIMGNPLEADVPNITGPGLNSAMNAARMPDKSLALSGEASQRLQATLDALRAQNYLQGLKRTATAGGGSDTLSNAVSHGVVHGALYGMGHGVTPSLTLQMLRALREIGTGKSDAAMAKLLSNPDELARQLSAFSRPQTSPLSAIGQAAYRAAPMLADQSQ